MSQQILQLNVASVVDVLSDNWKAPTEAGLSELVFKLTFVTF